MYVIIGKQSCIQCDEFKNLLDEKGIQYKYLDMTEMPNKTMTYQRMYCNSFPIVLNINHSLSNFEETLTHFNHIWIIFIYYIYIIIIILLLLLFYYCYHYYYLFSKERKSKIEEVVRGTAGNGRTEGTGERNTFLKKKCSWERECSLLVLNLVSSTLPCIRWPRPRLRVLDVCGFV
jgi:glutaredoxin